MDFGTFDDVEIMATQSRGRKIWLNIHIKERPRLSQSFVFGVRKGRAGNAERQGKTDQGTGNHSDDHQEHLAVIKKYYMGQGFLLHQSEGACRSLIRHADKLHSISPLPRAKKGQNSEDQY